MSGSKGLFCKVGANMVFRGLMARDDMANLGLGDVVDPSVPPPASMQTTSVSPSNPPHVPQPPPSEHRI